MVKSINELDEIFFRMKAVTHVLDLMAEGKINLDNEEIAEYTREFNEVWAEIDEVTAVSTQEDTLKDICTVLTNLHTLYGNCPGVFDDIITGRLVKQISLINSMGIDQLVLGETGLDDIFAREEEA